MNLPIVILGFMGAGKTTLGRELARRAGLRFVDLDEFVRHRTSRSIADIIDTEGEIRFREFESAALHELLDQMQTGVIALGGGTWTVPENRKAINEAGAFSVWLDTPFEICRQRIDGTGDDRPFARNLSLASTLYEQRRTSYALADLRIACEPNDKLDTILNTIVSVTGIANTDDG